MKEQEKNIDLIDKYLRNELNENELLQFEGKVIEDEAFGQLLHEMSTMVEGIKRSASQSSLEDKLKRLESYATQSPDSTPNELRATPEAKGGRVIDLGGYFKKYRVPMAAVLAILVTSVFAVINITRQANPADLFQDHFSPFVYMGPQATTRSASGNLTDEVQAIYYYERKDYQMAHQYFEKVLFDDPDNTTALFYSGNALLALGDHNKASEKFRRVIDIRKGLELQAKWYLAMCHLKSGEIEAMKPLLLEIAKSGTTYSPRANELLKALK
jgi:tetratricopeptide (TPR) repeat protein